MFFTVMSTASVLDEKPLVTVSWKVRVWLPLTPPGNWGAVNTGLGVVLRSRVTVGPARCTQRYDRFGPVLAEPSSFTKPPSYTDWSGPASAVRMTPGTTATP